ncbi:uncharacterized protein AKAME5_002560800 [Lates japonicus]|uniref:Uncharacterized protein n=1 Tax=Lates japonicus TaxID=270547 RepID=A0AAD3RKY0_LATJO|nr:uncharacterized protein AKAME5_002560800 [Lates japonicus]
MTGINNGVHDVLKEEYGLNDLLIRCVCHSLQLAVSHACNDTFHSREYLVRKTYNQFFTVSKAQPTDGYISPKLYLGYLYESKAAELHLAPEEKNNVRKRRLAFTISLTDEWRDNIEALHKMSVFNVEETHNKSLGEIEKIAKLLGYSPAEIDKIVQQWCAIHPSKWNETKNTVGF